MNSRAGIGCLMLSEVMLLSPLKEMYKYRLEFRSYNQVTYKEVFHGKNVTPESAQTKPGYNFVGWDKSLENITQDMVINAIYAPKEFTITVHDGDIFENKQCHMTM